MTEHWNELNQRIVACERCPRLREHCREISVTRRKAFSDWQYWGQPVPNFGTPNARLLIVGLAPAAHGANRTGRMFTGDQSGVWLYRALHKAGWASQAHSTSVDDGLQLTDCAISAVCHCAPPDNKPTFDEIQNCSVWFDEIISHVPARVYIALGQIAWNAVVDLSMKKRWLTGRKPKFKHAAEVNLASDRWLLGSYHPSQQNTFTRRLTEPMFDAVFQRARDLLAE